MKSLELILFSRLNPFFANLFSTMKQQKTQKKQQRKQQRKQQKSMKQQKVMKQDKQLENLKMFLHEFIEFLHSRQPAVPREDIGSWLTL